MNTTIQSDQPEPCLPVTLSEWLQDTLIGDGQAEDARLDASGRN